MSEYLFVLGRASELCQAEVKSVLAREKITHKLVFSSLEIFHISVSCPLDVNYLIRTLGGTIKIAEVLEETEEVNENVIVEMVTNLIQRHGRELDKQSFSSNKKINFGISAHGGFCSIDLNQWSKGIKQRLEAAGLKARFVLPSGGTILSSVVVSKQKLAEVILVKEKDKIVLAKTLVIQDFEDWGKRDFGRPAPDPHRGMLPPKVARMMVNLGRWKIEDRRWKEFTMVDPFCGVGTILMEGIMMGYRVIGSDQSKEAIEKTRKNLEWLKKSWNIEHGTWNILQSEATHISEKLPHGSIDAIVSEPYLGPLFETEKQKNLKTEKIKNIILGLEKLYIGCLRDWWKILKPNGRIVIALPSFRIGKGEFFVKKPLDTCENLGYTLVGGPYQYSRPQAIVVRNIYILRKKDGSY